MKEYCVRTYYLVVHFPRTIHLRLENSTVQNFSLIKRKKFSLKQNSYSITFKQFLLQQVLFCSTKNNVEHQTNQTDYCSYISIFNLLSTLFEVARAHFNLKKKIRIQENIYPV